jgi:hypothetical protein
MEKQLRLAMIAPKLPFIAVKDSVIFLVAIVTVDVVPEIQVSGVGISRLSVTESSIINSYPQSMKLKLKLIMNFLLTLILIVMEELALMRPAIISSNMVLKI